MLRFPNPGSTIQNFVQVYTAAFNALNGRVVTLDHIVEAVVRANLATSSGYMGAEAVSRSTRDDRSRDPLYNQIKMYAELFRTMGWLHPTANSSLNFTFTLLGEQVVAAGRDYGSVLDECILGIAYPTRVLAVKGDFELRPFAFIVRVMSAAGGYLSRDEMIIGPLSAASDRTIANLNSVVEKIVAARNAPQSIELELAALANVRKTQVNTLHNYTRWPIALLRDSGWMEASAAKFSNGKKYPVWALSEKGEAVAARLEASIDLRVSDLERYSPDERSAIAVIAHFQMLDRAGFDIHPMTARIDAAKIVAAAVIDKLGARKQTLLFSPFQSMSLNDIQAAFPAKVAAARVATRSPSGEKGGQTGRDDRAHLFVVPRLVAASGNASSEAEAVRAELLGLLKVHGTPKAAAAAFSTRHSSDTQTTFYPLVTHLFQLLGYRSEHSRAGVNYQRWDACVWVGDDAIPVEIKSPTEELFLSTKAVRQALENKVVLLSRGGLKTRKDFTSLVVGYKLPNERGDMSNLIDDVFAAYGLRLGVVDLESLAQLAVRSVADSVTIEAEQLLKLRGFINV